MVNALPRGEASRSFLWLRRRTLISLHCSRLATIYNIHTYQTYEHGAIAPRRRGGGSGSYAPVGATQRRGSLPASE